VQRLPGRLSGAAPYGLPAPNSTLVGAKRQRLTVGLRARHARQLRGDSRGTGGRQVLEQQWQRPRQQLCIAIRCVRGALDNQRELTPCQIGIGTREGCELS
jgi:hypothetical protein